MTTRQVEVKMGGCDMLPLTQMGLLGRQAFYCTHHQDLKSVASYETTLSSWMLAQICSFILFLFGKSHLCVSFMSLVTHVFGQCLFLSHEKVLNFAGRPSALTPPPPKKKNKSRYSEFHKTFLQMSEVDSRLELLLLASWSCLYMLLWQPAGSGIDYHGWQHRLNVFESLYP